MFHGEIVFDIADIKPLEIDFGSEIIPSKIVNKGEVVALGRKAPKNRWIYKIAYNGEKEYLESLDKMISRLCNKSEYVNELCRKYEEVSVNINIRSEFAEIGYSIPNHILQKMSLLDCTLDFRILSFGVAISE